MRMNSSGVSRVISVLLSAFLPILVVSHYVNVRAEEPVPGGADASQIEKFTPVELHNLVAPIALYPDALLAQILPASTFPVQIAVAYRYTQSADDPSNPPANSDWDSSVIALLHYPLVLKHMNDDLIWTEQLGMAVTYQMPEVTQAIQQVRAEAEAAGNLKSNDKQTVVTERDAIQIVPADPQFVFVPEYDPDLICYPYPYDTPLFTWGIGFGFGFWLCNDFDWWHHRIWSRGYWSGGGWHQRPFGSPWLAPTRPIPSWYLKSGGRGTGLATRPNGAGALTHSGNVDRVHPKFAPTHRTAVPHTPPTPSTPHAAEIRERPKFTIEGEGLNTTRQQASQEALRGWTSRGETLVPQHVAPAHTETYVPSHPSYHEEFQHYDSGRSVQQQSSRGSFSRGSGGGRR